MKCLLALTLLLPLASAFAAGQGPDSAPVWKARAPIALPELPPDLPATAAGCVVVGLHVLADGSSDGARVMTGAYTGGTEAPQQQEFARRVLASAKHWHFEALRPGSAKATFQMQTLGYVPADGLAHRVVVGVESLPQKLRGICQITELATWGEANAVSIERARADHDREVVVPNPATGESYWVYKTSIEKPVFPVDAIKAGVQACIVFGVVVEEDGVPSNLLLLRSEVETERGHSDRISRQMESSAAAAIATARFAPGPDNLGRRAAIVQVPIGYTTRESSGFRPDLVEENVERELRDGDLPQCKGLSKQELDSILNR